MQIRLRSSTGQRLAARGHRGKLWAAGVLGLAVAFTVFYLLALPAVTLESALICPLAEHTHSEACMGDVLVCDLPADGAETDAAAPQELPDMLICGLEESPGHAHVAGCQALQTVVLCGLEADDSHTHEAACLAQVPVGLCGLEETPAHTHEAACLAQPREADGSAPPHTHEAGCFAPAPVCGLEAHIHDAETCYRALQGIMPADFVGGYSSDLRDFLDALTIEDTAGNLIGDGDAVYIGEIYIITLGFSEKYPNPNEQFMYNGENRLTYQLPGSFVIASTVEGVLYYGTTNRVIGHYTISTSGVLSVWFEKGLNADGTPHDTPDKEYIDYHNVSFTIELSAKLGNAATGEGQTISFGDEATITVDIKERDAQLDVEKTLSRTDISKHTVTYDVVVKALGGTVDSITLEDVISFTQAYSANTTHMFDLVEISANTEIKKDGAEGYPKGSYVVAATTVDVDGAFTVSFNPALSLEAGEYFTLTYTVKFKDAYFRDGSGQFISGNYALFGELVNTVTAEGMAGGEPVSDTDTAIIHPQALLVDKSDGRREVLGDGNTYVKWTVRVGDGYFNLSGMQVIDALYDSMIFHQDVPLKVTTYTVDSAGQWNPTGDTFDVQWNTLNVLPLVFQGQNGSTFTWTIPDTATPLTYQLEYYTTEPDLSIPGNLTKLTNYAIVGDIDSGPWDSGTIGLPGAALDKTAVYTIDAATGLPCIQYTIKAFIPGAVKGHAMRMLDIMYYYSGSQPSIQPHILGVEFDLRDSANNLIPQIVYKPRLWQNTGDWAHEFGFLFGTDSGGYNDASEWLVDVDSTLTITYRVALDDQTIIKDGSGRTLAQVLQGDSKTSSQVRNTVKLDLPGGTLSDTHFLPPMITKSVKRCYWGLMPWSTEYYTEYGWIYEGGHNVFVEADYEEARATGQIGFYYQVDLNPGPYADNNGDNNNTTALAYGSPPKAPIFTDVFDPALIYAPGTMQIWRTDYSAGRVGDQVVSYAYPAGGGTEGQAWGPACTTPDSWCDLRPGATDSVDTTAGSGRMSLDFADIGYEHNVKTDYSLMALSDPYWYASPNSVYTVSYVLTFPGSTPPDEHTYENTATITVFTGPEDDTGIGFSSKARVTYGSPVVTKQMELAGKTARVTIDINPQGLLLTDGGTIDGILKLEDIMVNLSLYSRTLEVEVDYGSGWVTQTLSFSTEAALFNYTSQTTEDGERLTLWLPDGRPIRITYDALIQGSAGQTVDVSNSVEILGTGYGDSAGEHEYFVNTSQGWAGASSGGIQITKVDATQAGVYLPGAVFDIYSNLISLDGVDTDKTQTIGGVTYYYYRTVTIGSTGSSFFPDDAMLPDTLWAMIETTAPEGYMPDSTPIVFYFYGDEIKNIPQGAQEITDKIDVPNSPYHTLLPATGGGGLWAYTLAGLLLMAASAALALRRRRPRAGHPSQAHYHTERVMNMKTMKRILGLALALTLALALALPAGAANITVNDPNTAAQYVGYRLLNLTVSDKAGGGYNYAYAINETYRDVLKAVTEKTLDADILAYIAGLSADGARAFADAVYRALPDRSVTDASFAAGTSTSVTNGYWLLAEVTASLPDGSARSLVLLGTAGGSDFTASPKKDVPTLGKQVQENSTGQWGSAAHYEIGDAVPFRLTTKVPDMTGYTSYTFMVHDTMSPGLTFDPASLAVTVGGTAYSDYTLETSPGEDCTFHITFDPEAFCGLTQGQDILITYQATLNGSARIAPLDNPNEVYLEYSDDAYTGSTGQTPLAEATVYTFQLEIFKHTGTLDVDAAPLPGAGFTLRYGSAQGEPVQLVDLGGGAYRAALSGETAITQLTSPESGVITLQGLDAGTYHLEETAVPGGYNKADPCILVIEDNDIDGTHTLTVDGVHATRVAVQNNSGTLFPSTGGIGTVIFTVVGLVLMVGAAIVLIAKKKMSVR